METLFLKGLGQDLQSSPSIYGFSNISNIQIFGGIHGYVPQENTSDNMKDT